MASHLCFCDSCGPQGALQARSTISIHAKAQETRSRLSGVETNESPHVPARQHAGRSLEATTHEQRTRLPVGTIESRLEQFIRPQGLKFRYPPETPTAMYPGSGDDETWNEGPSSLRAEDPVTANVLLHLSFLLRARESVQSNYLEGGYFRLRERVLTQLAEMEVWRMSEWTRQQRQAPDPEGLGRKLYRTGKSATVRSCHIISTIS